NGNFFLKSTVTIDRSYVHIMGLNHGLRSGIDPSDGTTQTGGGGAKVTVQNSISAFKIQNTHNDKRLSGITFSGFDLKGDTNGGVGIDGASNTDRVVIDNMTINNIGTGVKLNGADAPRITNSWIAETKSSIQLTGASQQAEIKNNSLGAQPQGITVLLENADRYNISGNNIYPDGSSAIRLLNPVHGAIVGNTISAYYTGIIEMLPNDNTYGNSNVISGNVIAIESWKNNPIGRDSKWGIIHIEGYDNLISGNNILANGSPQDTTGILIMKGDRNKIATNVITIPNTSSKVVCNGSANNNTVVYSTDSSSFQNGLNSSNQNIDFDEVNALKKNYAILETQLNVLQGQMADLLGAISISGDTLQINGKLAVRGNVTTYWDGADQFIVYSGHNFKRGYFGMYDNGQFKVNG
ncbi:right-handed parallel beta-helix repeat-containing protein, partial [Lactobacillus jensenii]